MSKQKSVKSVLDAAGLDTPWSRRLKELDEDGIYVDERDLDYTKAVRDANDWCGCAVGELKSTGVLEWEMIGDEKPLVSDAPADEELRDLGVAFSNAADDADWLGAAEAQVAIHKRAAEIKRGEEL